MAMCLVVRCVRRVCAQCVSKRRGLHVSPDLQKIVQYKLSDIGEGIREVTVKSWYVKVDDVVSQFDDICEVESDKAAVTITSRYDGKVAKLYHNVGEIALVGNPLVDIEVEDSETSSVLVTESDTSRKEINSAVLDTATEPSTEKWNKSLATPAVRRIAMEHKVKLDDVRGTGKHGRVMKEDILEFINKLNVPSVKLSDKVEPLTTVQRVMTRTMTKAHTIPTLLYCDEVNVTGLVQLRKEVKSYAEKKGVKLSFLPFILKAISKGILEYPILNSSIDDTLENIVYKKSHNIGLAVDSPTGLLVPNIKNLQDLTIMQIAKEIHRIHAAALAGKLTPSELTGGTFSVSNVGSVGGTYTNPLILPPEVCIVALGKIQTLPRFDAQGNVYPSDVLYVSCSADHRIIDGATVSRFTNLWKNYLENPSTLMLDL